MPGWSGKTQGWSPHVASKQSVENINVCFYKLQLLIRRGCVSQFLDLSQLYNKLYIWSSNGHFLFVYVGLFSHLQRFPFAWIWVLHLLQDRLLWGDGELLPLADQLLFELVLVLRVQELLPERDVWEHGGKRPAQLDGRFGAFLKRGGAKLKISVRMWEQSYFLQCDRKNEDEAKLNAVSQNELNSANCFICRDLADKLMKSSLQMAFFCPVIGFLWWDERKKK